MSSNTRAGVSSFVRKSGSGSDVPEPEAAATVADVAKLKHHAKTVIEAEHRRKRERPISDLGSGLVTQPVTQRLPVQSAFQEGLGGGRQAEVKAGAVPSGDGAGGPRTGCTSSVKHVRFAEYLQGQGQKDHHLGMVHASQGVQRSVSSGIKSVHTQVATQNSGDGGSTAPSGRIVAAANSTNEDSGSASGAAGAAGGLNPRLARLLFDALSGQRRQASGLGGSAVSGAAVGTAGPTAAGPAAGHPATDTTPAPRGSLHLNCSSGAISGGGVGPTGAAGGRNARLAQALLGALSEQQHQTVRLSCGTLSDAAASTAGALVTNKVPRRLLENSAVAVAIEQLLAGAGAAVAPGTGSGRKRRKLSTAATDDAGGPITKAARARTSRASLQMQRLPLLLWKPGAEDSDRLADSSECSDENEDEDDDDKNDDTGDEDDDDDDDDNDDDDNDDNEGVAFNNDDDNEEAGEDEGEEVNKDDRKALADILHEALGGMMELDWNSDGDWLRSFGSGDEGVEDEEHADVDDSEFEERREPKEKVTEEISKGEDGTEGNEDEVREGKRSGEPGNEDGRADAGVRGSTEPTQTVSIGQAPGSRRSRRIPWRSVRRKRWRQKADEYKKRLPGGCLPGASTLGVLMSSEELWDARLLAKSCLVIEEQPEIRHWRQFRKRLPDDLNPQWTQLNEAVDTELKLSQAMAAGAPLQPRTYPRPCSSTAASAAADGTESGREIMTGGWLLPYDTGSTPYWSARPTPQLDPGAGRGVDAAMGDAGDNGNATDIGGVGGAMRDRTTHFGYRIKGHSSRLRGVSVQEARARAARLYRTGSSGKLSTGSSSSITISSADDSSSCSGSDAMADVDGEAAAAVMAAEEGGEGFGAGICGFHLGARAGLRASARVRKVDELLAVPDPECDDGVAPADDVRLESANTAFFDGYFWEQSRTVQKQYNYTVRDGLSTSRPNSQGLGSRRRWRFAHWELTLRCTHPECGAEKLIHLPAAVPGRLTLEQLAASGLRVWVVRPAGYRGGHNHAPPGGGGVLRCSGRPLSELHRLVPEGLQADIPLATMLPIPLPQSAPPRPQQLPVTVPTESAANATKAANVSCYGGIPPSYHSLPPSQRAAAAIWLLEPPPPPVWKCRGWTWKAREPGGSPQLDICGAINRAGDGPQGNIDASGSSGSAGRGSAGSLLRNSCASCGTCRPDGRHGLLRQLVNAAVDQHDPASVTPLQLHEHVAKASAFSGSGASTVPMFSLPEVTADAFVILMQRVARALLHYHLPPLLPSPPPSSTPLLLPPRLGDNNNVEVQDTVVKSIVEAVFKSGAWSWPGIILLHADLGACPPDVAAISAARALGGQKALKVARKDIVEDPERFVMGDGDRLELQRAAGVLGVAGGSGGGGSGPPVVDVEEVGDWHMPLAFRQLQRRIAETYNINVTAKALADGFAAEAAGAQAASETTSRAGDEAARPCFHQGSEMQQAQTSRISKAAEEASHAVMALLGSLETAGDLRHPQDHPIGMPYMVSVPSKRRRLDPEPVVVGAGSSGKGAYSLCRQEWFHHCLRQQLHPECEVFGGPVGQQAGMQLHATGPLHWLPKVAQQQAAVEAAAAVVLQTGAGATASPESLAAMFRSAVNQSDRRYDSSPSGAAAGDVSVSAMANAAAAGAQLDLLSVNLVAPPAELELSAAAIAANIGQHTPAAAAPAITLLPAAAATMYHANIALARSSMSAPVIRPIFHRRGIPPGTVSLIVQFSTAFASRQRAALLPTHVAMSKRRRKELPRLPEHPPWALESTAMRDPWDIVGIATVQQASGEDGQWYDANGGGNRGGKKLTQRMLSAAADAVEANPGARDGGSSPGYAWRPWVPATDRQAPSSQHSQRGARPPMTATGVEGHRAEVSNSQILEAGQGKLKAGSQHGSAAVTGAAAAASGSGATQAANECSRLPPSVVMVEELARRSIFCGWMGEDNDYVGKGMNGGAISILPPPKSPFQSEDASLVVVGRLFVDGRASERFAVCNSLAEAVVEGAGDHCCEYMTGCCVVVLGAVGRNVAAGMTGGLGYFLDEDGSFCDKVNTEIVAVQRVITTAGEALLKGLIQVHYERTGSSKAKALLANWEVSVGKFWQLVPPAEKNTPEVNPSVHLPQAAKVAVTA